MKYRGTIVYPLYVAPYNVPAQLMADCGGKVGFDPISREPIIRSTFNIGQGSHAPYFHCIVPSPFDFGWTLYNPSGEGQAGYEPGALCGWDGNQMSTFNATDGNRSTGQLAIIQALAGPLAIQYGIQGSQYNGPPVGEIGSFGNGFTDHGAVGDDQQQAPYYASIVASGCVDFNGTASCVFVPYSGGLMCTADTLSGTSYLITGLAAPFQNVGFPSFMNEYAAFWPPSTDYPEYRWYIVADQQYSNQLARVGYGGTLPYTLLLDEDPGLEDCFSNMQNGELWIGVSGATTFDGNNFTVIMIDPSTESYYKIQLVPKTLAAQIACLDISKGLPTIKLRKDGVLFLNSKSDDIANQIFHSQGFILDYQPIVVPYPPPFVLPCFNPCLPLIKSS